jgi:hypothetical protein
MSNILDPKNVFELADNRAAWAAKIAEHPYYNVTMTYNDGDVVRYEGRLRMMYHGRFHDFPDGITDADAMLHYCRMKEAGMTPTVKNSDV